MSSYVRRTLGPGETWTGPIRSRIQVEKEAEAWRFAGWTAVVEPSTPAIRAEVRAWQTKVQADRR